MKNDSTSRRTFLKGLGAGLLSSFAPLSATRASQMPERVTKPIPSSGEQIPVVGMGTWQTFNVGDDPKLRDHRARILDVFFEAGGGLIDSSPMYGSSQNVVGYGLKKLGFPEGLVSADKVWTREGDATRSSVESSAEKWQIEQFDVMQVHNLLAWRDHLRTLREMKKKGAVRYIGVTTSHGRRHEELERIMENHRLDFVQLTYNLIDRDAERRLLPLAKERGIAVIANRPYRGGSLVDRFQGNAPLPDWAPQYGISNWPQFLLKFIVSHPAVTCAIPATTQIEHMRENMGAARSPLPNPEGRQRMVKYVDSL